MKRGWPSLPATVICLFALATSASAECAWVQWSWISTPGLSPEEQRQQEGGFATLKDCHEALKRSYLSVGVPPHVIPAFISNHKLRFVGKRSDGGELTGWGICLPDTVDPLVPGWELKPSSVECAWVLWGSHDQDRPAMPWTLRGAYQSFSDCTQALDAIEQDARKNGWKTERRAASELFFMFDTPLTFGTTNTFGTSTDFSFVTSPGGGYHCLPDTVNPRGPKGVK